ncbi:VOC family protein [Haloactinopolyspora sp.]|uniref:VOC family protein n=1 Tax=Haloactinopolyspora sp. TaxID=1966353 RepID=UPI002603A1A3|nr:VOC family protein [Haloactinopolyspora sp.]
MRVEVDHVVWASPDLGALVERVAELTGVTPVFGGRHEGRGTQNYLLGLGGERYLELLGPDPSQPEPDLPRPMRVDELTGPALVGWAVRTTAIHDVITAARNHGYDPGAVTEMSRRTTDDTLLTWRLTPPEGGLDGVVPFVIDWLHSPHPATRLPSVELASLTVHHPEPARVSAALTALGLLDESVVTVAPAARPGITAVVTTPHGDVSIP